MALVTNEELHELLPFLEQTLDLTPFIETANLLTTEDLAGAGHTNKRLKQIELYMAAHFSVVAFERGSLRKVTAGDSSETFAVKVEKNFNLTRFGQQAMSFDTSGKLRAIGSSSTGPARLTLV